MKYAKKVDEDAKTLALKSIMPDASFGEAGAFRGRSFKPLCGLAHSYHQQFG